jgi:predicted Zn-dependent protease
LSYVPKRLENTADVSRGQHSWRETLANLAIVLGVLSLSYLSLGIVAEKIAERVPATWESRLAAMDSFFVDVASSEDRARIEPILDRLLAAGGLRRLRYRLIVTDDETPNAFAFPGGTIGVTKGLLDTVQGEAGLAMVIGHELGHHDSRHVLKRLGRGLLIVLPATALSAEAGHWVGKFLQVVESKYSRDQEREADEIGLELVNRAFGTTDGVLEFFEKMLAKRGDRSPWATMMATHPGLEERIVDLRSQASRLESNADR